MNVINKCENIKKKNENDVKKIKPLSMWQLAEQENKQVIKPPATPVTKPAYQPLSMWQMAEREPKPRPVKKPITRITREHIPDISKLKDSDFVDVIADDGTRERWTIRELKACLVEHLDAYTRQGNTFAYRVLSQFDDTRDFLPHDSINDEDNDAWFQESYTFGEHGHGEHNGKRENLKTLYEISLNDRAKRAKLFRNRFILSGLEDFANVYDYRATLLTITCNRESVAQSKQCVVDLWNALQKHMKKLDIKNFGIKSLEQQKSGKWHMHAIVFTPSKHTENMEKNVYPKYANHPHDNGQCVKRIYRGTARNVCKYITKIYVINDHDKHESKFNVLSESRFFGLPKGVIKSYDDIYKYHHKVAVYDDNELTNGERKQLAHIKSGLSKSERKQMNHERYVKLHIQKKNGIKILDALGCFQKLKKCVAWWLSKNKNIQVVSFPESREQSKNGGCCRVVDKNINIIKKITQNIRGPPLADIQVFTIMSTGKRSQIMESKHAHKHITGIPPPCRQHQYARHATNMPAERRKTVWRHRKGTPFLRLVISRNTCTQHADAGQHDSHEQWLCVARDSVMMPMKSQAKKGGQRGDIIPPCQVANLQPKGAR